MVTFESFENHHKIATVWEKEKAIGFNFWTWISKNVRLKIRFCAGIVFYIIKSYSPPWLGSFAEDFFYRIHIQAKKEEDGWSKMVCIITISENIWIVFSFQCEPALEENCCQNNLLGDNILKKLKLPSFYSVPRQI